MTSHEILKADVLDILFDNRNKMYGAYELRKEYNHRLMIALGSMLGIVFLFILLSRSITAGGETLSEAIDKEVVKLIDLIPDIPEPEKPEPILPQQQQPIAQEKLVNQIEIVSDDVAADMPTMDDLANAAISNQHVDGPAYTDAKQPDVAETPSPGTVIGEKKEETQMVDPIEKNAQFPGGQQAWMNFLQRHLRTPDELEPGQKVVVLVRFEVAADGSLSNFQIVQSGGNAFDKEVIRALKKMPNWLPAVQNGHHVPVLFMQPVTFMALSE